MSSFRPWVVIFILSILSVFKTYSQPSFSQEKAEAFFSPVFKDGIPGMMNFFNKEIIPIISRNTKDLVNLPASLKMVLTIDKTGNVIDVRFLNTKIGDKCKRAVTNRLLEMKGWKSGAYKGKPIKGEYTWNISCLLWE